MKPHLPYKGVEVGFFLLFLNLITTSVYSQTSLIFPGSGNIFRGAYELPDGTLRIISDEYGSYRDMFFVDMQPDGSITEPSFYPQSFNDVNFNFGGYDVRIIRLSDGSAILGLIQVDCDYSPPSGLYMTNPQGEVVWAKDLGDVGWGYDLEKLTIVDSNVYVAIVGEEKYYFDDQGTEVNEMGHFIMYDQIAQFDEGYFSSLDDQLYLLDPGFDKVDSLLLDTSIISLHILNDSLVLVSTHHSVYLLNPELSLIAHSAAHGQITLSAITENLIWLAQDEGSYLYSVDLALQPVDTFAIHPDIKMGYLQGRDSLLVLTGNYNGSSGYSSFFHASSIYPFSFDIKNDVRIDDITVPGHILYHEEPFSYGGFNLSYPDVVVQITNSGLETIDSVRLHYTEGIGCGMCDSWKSSWLFDSLNVLPGDSITLSLPIFRPWCVQINPKELCLWAEPLHSLPEINSDNNYFCTDVEAFPVGLENITSSKFTMQPNPAKEKVRMIVNDVNEFTGSNITVFASDGRIMYRNVLTSNILDINVENWTPGLYYVIIANKTTSEASKLVVSR